MTVTIERPSDLTHVLRAAQAGDEAAFTDLVVRFHGRVRRLCSYMLPPCEVDDAVQDVFLQTYVRLAQLQEPAAFPAWLSKLATRVCGEKRRKYQARKSTWDRLLQFVTGQSDAGPLEHLAERDALQKGLDQLTPEHRSALLLYEVMELDVKEIATVLGVAEGTVKSRLFTARRRLAALLGDHHG